MRGKTQSLMVGGEWDLVVQQRQLTLSPLTFVIWMEKRHLDCKIHAISLMKMGISHSQ